MDILGLVIALAPLVEKLIALRQARADAGLPPPTEAEARAELQAAGTALDQKIQDWLDAHPI